MTNQPTETRERQQQHSTRSNISLVASSSFPFVTRGSALRSALRPAPVLAPPPFARFQKSLEGGRSSSLAVSHRVSTNRERMRHPSPFSLSTTTIRRKIQAGVIQAGDLCGRYSGGRCPSAPLLLPPASFTRPAEIVAARCALNGEWRRWWWGIC